MNGLYANLRPFFWMHIFANVDIRWYSIIPIILVRSVYLSHFSGSDNNYGTTCRCTINIGMRGLNKSGGQQTINKQLTRKIEHHFPPKKKDLCMSRMYVVENACKDNLYNLSLSLSSLPLYHSLSSLFSLSLSLSFLHVVWCGCEMRRLRWTATTITTLRISTTSTSTTTTTKKLTLKVRMMDSLWMKKYELKW